MTEKNTKKLVIVYVNFISLILANFAKIINFRFTINFIKKLAFYLISNLISHKKLHSIFMYLKVILIFY